MNLKIQAALDVFWRAAPDGSLSERASTQMLYLLDWKNTLTHGVSLTGLVWTFGMRGPEADGLLFDQPASIAALNHSDMTMVDFVASVTVGWNDVALTKLVYSTYPIITGQKHTILNLSDCAKAYKALTNKRESPVTTIEPA